MARRPPRKAVCVKLARNEFARKRAPHNYCVLPNNIRLHVQTDRTGPVRISIKPDLIKVIPPSEDTPGMETHRGKLLQLIYERDRVRALIDIGVPISVLIPVSVFDNMCLVLGEEACLACPTESVVFF
ncbi:MAG: hypothetical protein JW882_12795 [Deltaproteobacteria bacterium]|nr:hypothetical protein [Deltaproteobacteria bacterium]